jgi:hypothetical protein
MTRGNDKRRALYARQEVRRIALNMDQARQYRPTISLATSKVVPPYERSRFRSAVSLGFVLWRAIGDTKNVLALHCSLRPCARKVDIGPLLIVGSGFTSPTHRFLGVLPELISRP